MSFFSNKKLKMGRGAGRTLGIFSAIVLFLGMPIQAFAQATPESSSILTAFLGGIVGGADFVFGGIFEWITELIFHLTAWVLSVAGYLLDISIQTSISASTYNSITAINVVWDVVRDFANIFFLFGLLYIAIATILNLGNYKRYIATIIIAALFVNFSLFFTKVIVDVANVFTVYFWQTASQVQINGVQINSISGVFMEAFDLETTASDTANPFDVDKLSNTNRGIAYIFAAIAMLVATFVFLSGAIMFIMRTITIIFLMVLSPLAFVAAALPGLRGHATRWWNSLMSAAFFAPVFMFFIYLVAEVARTNSIGAILGGIGGSLGSAIATAITGQATATSLGPIFSYILILGLLIGSIVAAKSIAGNLASNSTKWAKIGMGAAYGTAGGLAFRNTIGRGSAALANSQWMKNVAAKSTVGAYAERRVQQAASASYDFRSLKGVGGYGKAQGKGGVVKAQEERSKVFEEQGKRLSKNTAGETMYERATADTTFRYKDGTAKLVKRGEAIPLTENIDGNEFIVQKKGKGGVKEDQYKTLTTTYAERLEKIPTLAIPYTKKFRTNNQAAGWLPTRNTALAKRMAAQKLKKTKSPGDEIIEAAKKLAEEEMSAEPKPKEPTAESKPEGGEEKA